MAGYCDTIRVTINKDNSITVVDNGRVFLLIFREKPENRLWRLYLRFFMPVESLRWWIEGVRRTSWCSVHRLWVNALSEWLEVTVHHQGKKYFQRYERGKVVTPVQEHGDTTRPWNNGDVPSG